LIVAESRRGRRLMIRLERGVELCGAILEICGQRGVRAGEVRGVGTLGAVELRGFDPARRAWAAARRFDTPSTIVQLLGHIAQLDGHTHLVVTCAVARSGDNGIEVLGGYLVRGEAYAVELVIDTCEDVLVQRRVDPDLGVPLWSEGAAVAGEASSSAPVEEEAPPPAAAQTREVGTWAPTLPKASKYPSASSAGPARSPSPQVEAPHAPAKPHAPSQEVRGPQAPSHAPPPAADPQADPAASAGWGDVIAASRENERSVVIASEDPPEEPSLRPGDSIDHPKFGRCDVERIEGDSEFAQVRLRNGRLVRLSLDVLQLELVTRDGPRRQFRARTPR